MPLKARHVVVLALALAVGSFAAGAWFTQRVARQPAAAAAGEPKVLRYICPMHPQYTSDRPGDAPCCGMRLEPVYADGGGPDATAGQGAASLPPGTVRVTPEKQQVVGVRLVPVIFSAPV